MSKMKRVESFRPTSILPLKGVVAAAVFLLPLAARAQTFTVLHSFNGASDGANPHASLLQASDGNFYGTTTFGGTGACGGGCGTVFRMDGSGNLTTLHNFTGSDGSIPFARLIQASDGMFYGTTYNGGAGACSGGCGTVFRMDGSGAVTTLHSFNNTDGADPYAGLIQASDGNFYGTTESGGTGGFGTIYRMNGSGNVTTLHNFTGPDGATPDAGLIQASDGNFYGMTERGGSGSSCLESCGTVFKMDSSGNLTTLHNFTGTGTDGADPSAGFIQASDGALYATASAGGASNSGIVFRMSLSGNLTTLHSFGGSDGAEPLGALIQASDGDFYGTSRQGGPNSAGTVFKMDGSGNLTTLHNFDGTDGSSAYAGLVQASDGSFYGTAEGGGASGDGVIFRLVISACTTPGAPSPLLVNGGASATILVGQAYTLTWPDTLAAAGEPGQYEVKVSVNGGASYIHVAYVAGPSYEHTTLSSDGGRAFLFTVTAEPSCGSSNNSSPSNSVSLTVNPALGGVCTPNDTTLCLNGGRFQVQASWTDFQGNAGSGHVVPGVASDDSGIMWFFGASNWELLIKVLNGCGVNVHYWVFGAAATNVEYVIQVTDSQTGEVRTYTNPLGTMSPAITDAAAFGTCP